MPAPAVRLRAEFSDILGEEWQLNIHDADYAGSIVTFNVGGDAYQLRYEGNNEDRHQPIIGSSLEFSIIENSANITTFIDYLPNSQDGELTVTLRYDPDGVNTLYWAGVILPEQVVRKDEAYPQEVRIIASDDLGNLAGIDFDNDGTPYIYSDGRSLRDIIVKHCLGKIRTKDHWGASDIYASLDSAFTPSNLYGTGDFFSNIIVNSETWLNVQPNGEQKLFSTMEVLRTVCITFNARLFLANGRFWMIPIVSHHDSQTLTYLNYYNNGSYTSSSTVDVGLTLQTDLIKEAGWEYTHQLPLKRVERSFAFNANNPIGVEEEHLEASFNTDIFNFADYTFPAGTQFQISGYYTHSMTAQGGNNTLARLHANFFIKSGTKYHKHQHTYSGAAYYYNFPNSHSPTVLGDSTWTTSSADRTQVPLLNLNAATGDTFPVITNTYKGFGYTTDPLPTEETGIQIQVDFVVRNPNGTTNSTWKSATNLNFYWIELRVLNADGDSINYVATNALNARSTLDQGQVYIGDYMGTGPPYGKLYVKTGASTFSTTETWTSTTFTTGQDIHRLGVQEVLRGQKLPLLIERGTLYANNVGTLLHMYNVVLSDSRRMGIYQYTYNGRMRNYDIELFHITGNASDISVVGKPPRDVLPPIAPSSTNSTLNDGIVDEVGQTKFELDDLDATVTGIGTKLDLLYDTFQPKGDDFAKTSIKYEDGKTDGGTIELEPSGVSVLSGTGNSSITLEENSPGVFELNLQDDATPTAASVLALYATAAAGTPYVGIGTRTPLEVLDIVGNVNVDGDIIINGLVDGVDVSALKTTVDGITGGSDINVAKFWAFYLAD